MLVVTFTLKRGLNQMNVRLCFRIWIFCSSLWNFNYCDIHYSLKLFRILILFHWKFLRLMSFCLKGLLDMVKSINSEMQKTISKRKWKTIFQKRKSSSNFFVSADKTTNLYETPPNDFKKLLCEKITNKTYKKSANRLEHAINMEAKHIAKNIKLDDRIKNLAKTSAFITSKDHKENFRFSHPCRLINPWKSELGKVSTALLENVNTNLVDSLKINQWKDTYDVVNWFNAIKDKNPNVVLFS